jgi:uncharacterized protein YodC (DUF2158 family)
VVILKSGGPSMTVSDTGNNTVICIHWCESSYTIDETAELDSSLFKIHKEKEDFPLKPDFSQN